MQRILLVEDAEDCRLIVNASLQNEICLVTTAPSLTLAQLEVNRTDVTYDLILLDLGLPGGDGLSFLQILQNQPRYKNTPTLMLTGSAELTQKVKAFELGAEDYLVKPINAVELRARVAMRLRKADVQKTMADVFTCGDLSFDLKNMRVAIFDGTKKLSAELTTREFRLLIYLAQNENATFSRAQLVEAVCGNNVHILERTIDSHICAIRKKIKPLGGYIQSLAGSGYCLTSRSVHSQAS